MVNHTHLWAAHLDFLVSKRPQAEGLALHGGWCCMMLQAQASSLVTGLVAWPSGITDGFETAA